MYELSGSNLPILKNWAIYLILGAKFELPYHLGLGKDVFNSIAL